MGKWLITLPIVLGLAGLAASSKQWLPPLLFFVGTNSNVIQGLTDLVQLFLWASAGVALVVRVWQGQRASSQSATVATGGRIQGVVESSVGGDILGPGAQKVVHYHDATTGTDEKALLESYLNRLLDEVRWLNLGGIDPALAVDPGGARLHLASVYTHLDCIVTGQPEELEFLVSEERKHIISGAEWGAIKDETQQSSSKSAEVAKEVKELYHNWFYLRQSEVVDEPSRVPVPPRVPLVEVVNQNSCTVILGDPGSGKSTFIDFVTLCLAGEGLRLKEANLHNLGKAWIYGWKLPIRVLLRDMVARGLLDKSEKATGDHLWQFLKAELGETLASFAPVLYKHLQNEGALVMFDGFDEVPEAERRRSQVIDAIQGFVRDFPRCRFILTSRPYAWRRQAWWLPGFAEAVIIPFSKKQIQDFVDRWYTHFRMLRRADISAAEAQGRATLLKHAIQSTPGLAELAPRPLCLL